MRRKRPGPPGTGPLCPKLTLREIAERFEWNWRPRGPGQRCTLPYRPADPTGILLDEHSLWDETTGELLDAVRLIARMEHIPLRDARRTLWKLEGHQRRPRQRKLSHGQASDAFAAYIARRLEQSPNPWIYDTAANWATWSHCSLRTARSAIDKLRTAAEKGTTPILTLCVSHTFQTADGQSKTRWELIFADVRRISANPKLWWTSITGRDRHVRQTQRGPAIDFAAFQHILRVHFAAWEKNQPQKEVSAVSGDIRGNAFSLKKTSQKKDPGTPDPSGHPPPFIPKPIRRTIPHRLEGIVRRTRDDCLATHWDTCAIRANPANAYAYARDAILAGYDRHAIIQAYETALLQCHQLAKPWGETWEPSSTQRRAWQLLTTNGKKYTPPLPVTLPDNVQELIRASLEQGSQLTAPTPSLLSLFEELLRN